MPSIRKRTNGLYEARIYFKGKRFSVYERNLKTLKTKITRKIKELKIKYKNEQSLVNNTKEKTTLHEFYEKWLEQDKKPFIREKTLKIIKGVFNVHILPKLGEMKIKDITKDILQKFLNAMPKTRTKELCTLYLKNCIVQAYKEEYINKNPFDLVKIDKRTKKQNHGFSADEQEKILNYLKNNKPNLHKIIMGYLCTGCRRSELLTLKKENIQNNYMLIDGTKTMNSKRFLKITNELNIFLLNHIDLYNKQSAHYIAKLFKQTLHDLKIEGSIHSLRHTFATNHFYLGTPAKDVQIWLGHSTIQLTLDIYTNIDPRIDATTEKLKIKKIYNNLYYYSD